MPSALSIQPFIFVTTLGATEAMALAIRHMPDFHSQFSFRLDHFLAELPQPYIAWLANMPTLETVPEGLKLLADFDLILQRTQTKKWGFRLMTANDLIEFFAENPIKTPHPSLLSPPEGGRADDIAASDRMAQSVKAIYNAFHGVTHVTPADEIDPAEFDWDVDVWEFLL